MTEEEVNAKFLEMNQEIFTNKLNIDLDKCYKNLIVVFNNVISAFKNDMELRIYEISFDSESILSREEIGNKIEGLFSKFRDYITNTVNRDEELLKKDINNKDLDNYKKNIDLFGEELIKGIDEIYLNNMAVLLNDFHKYMDSYSNARLDKILKQIIYNHFMERCRMTIYSIHNILKNNMENNKIYLENMNKSSVKTR